MFKKVKQVLSLLLAMVLIIGGTIVGQPQHVSAETVPYLKLFYFNTVGDSTLMLLKTNEQTYSILIDTGESGLMGKLRYDSLYDQLEFGTSAAHKYEKVLDYVFITHPHSDHTNGLEDILKSSNKSGQKGFVIRNLIINSEVGSGASAAEKKHKTDLENLITDYSGTTSKPKKVIKTTYVKTGSGIVDGTIGGLLDYTYMPSPELYSTTNNNSMLIKFSYGSNNFVFSGDIGDRIEDKIVKGKEYYSNVKEKLKTGANETTYLKLPHHGSRRVSTSYLKDSSFSKIFPTEDIIQAFINDTSVYAANFFTKNGATYTFEYSDYTIPGLINRDEEYNRTIKGSGRLIGIGNVKNASESDGHGPISDTMSCFALIGLDEYHDVEPNKSIVTHRSKVYSTNLNQWKVPSIATSGDTYRVVISN